MNNKKTPTLSINDIVLLKERPQDYLKIHAERLTKTHDGTSSGPIKSNIKNFINRYSQDPFRRVVAFDSEGEKIVDHLTHYHNQVIWDDALINSEQTNMHVIMNANLDAEGLFDDEVEDHQFIGSGEVTRDKTNPNFYAQASQDYTVFINENEARQLCVRNNDGEYVVRSVTMVSPNKETMTLIKDNNFSYEDHQKLINVMREAYDMSFKDSDDYMKMIGPKLEECHVKVKFQKNSDVEAEPMDKWTRDRFKEVEEVMDVTDIYLSESDIDTRDFIHSVVGASGDSISFYNPKY